MQSKGLAPGVWAVVATPFSGPNVTLDELSLARLVEHYEQIGATGLTVLGVFGEAASLSWGERRTALRIVNSATTLPLVIGVTTLATAPVIDEIRLAQELVGDRLAAAMVQVNSPHPEVLAQHLDAIHQATGANLVVQDYPLVSGVQISSVAIIAAIQTCAGVVAVKAESPPTPVAVAGLTAAVDIPVFGGLGGLGLLDELACGAAGAMTGFSFPEGLIACVQAWRDTGYEAAREALLPYLPLINFEQQAKVALAIRKESLCLRQLILDPSVRPPAASMPEALREQLARHLTALRAVGKVR